MAKKPKQAPKKRGRPKGKAANKNKARQPFKVFPKGPTAAQKKAAAAQRTRQFRLQVANSAQAQANTFNAQARLAAIRAFAVKRTYQIAAQGSIGGQQGAMIKSLQARAGSSANVASQALYAARGVQRYATAALSRTLTTAQALASNAAFFKKFGRKLSKAQWAAYFAKLNKKKQRQKASVPAKRAVSGRGRGRPKGKTQGAIMTKAITAGQAAILAQTKKAPVQQAKKRGARAFTVGNRGWLHGYNNLYSSCVATAIANRLRALGFQLSDMDVLYLMDLTGEETTIEEALRRFCAYMKDALTYFPATVASSGVIIGFEAETGPHAAYSPSPEVAVLWGQEAARPDTIEEAWFLGWNCSASP